MSLLIKIDGDTSSLQSALSTAGSVAVKTMAAATTAVVGLGTAATAVGKEFETSLAGTSTMFGDVEVDVAGLTDQMLELSSETGLASTAISDSLYNALSAGIPVTEDMTGAMDYMESSAKLAAAGFTDIDTAVTATAKVMNAYGMTLDDVDSIQTIMLQTQNKGITTVDELGASLAQVTPTASAMGVSFENVGASLATMTAQGTATAQATTQLNSLIAELGKSGTTAAGNLELAAQGTEYAGMSFTEMMDAGVPLNEVLDLMDTYASDSNLSMIDLFSSLEAGKAALALAGENSATYAENLEAMGTEADVVGEAYDKVTDTLDHQIEVLTESTKNLGIAVYQDLSDPLKDTAKKASGWIEQVTDAFSEGGLGGAVGAVGDVLADVVNEVVNMAPEIVDAAVSLVSGLIEGIENRLPEIVSGAVAVGQSFIEGIITLVPQIISAGVQLILQLATGIASALPSLIPMAVDAVVTIVSGLIDNIPLLVTAALAIVTGLAEGLLIAIPDLVAVAPELILSLITALTDNLPLIIETGVTLLVALIEALPQIITTITNAMPTIITAIVDALVDNIDLIVDAGITVFLALIDALPEIIVQLLTAVPAIMTALVNGFMNMLDSMVDVGKDLVRGLWDGIQSMGGWLLDMIKSWANSILDSMKSFFGIASPSKETKEMGEFLDEGLGEGVKDGAPDLMSKVKAQMAKVREEFSGVNIGVQSSVAGIMGTSTGTIASTSTANGATENNSTLLSQAVALLQSISDSQGQDITLDGQVIYANQQKIGVARGYNLGMGVFAR